MAGFPYLNDVTSASWDGFSSTAPYPSATPPYVALFEGGPSKPTGAYYRSMLATAGSLPVGSSLDGVRFTFSVKTKSFENQIEFRLWPENEPLNADSNGSPEPPTLNVLLARFYFRKDNLGRGPVSPSGGSLTTPNATLGFADADLFDTFTVELSEVSDTTLEVRVYDSADNLLQTYNVSPSWFTAPPSSYVFEPNPGEVYEYSYPFADGPYPADFFEPGSPAGYYGRYFAFSPSIPAEYPRYGGYLIPVTETTSAPPYDPALGWPALKASFSLSMYGANWNEYVFEPNPGETYSLGINTAAYYAANFFEPGSPAGYYAAQHYSTSTLPSQYIDAGYGGNQYYHYVGPLTPQSVLAFEDVEVSVADFTLAAPASLTGSASMSLLSDGTGSAFTLTPLSGSAAVALSATGTSTGTPAVPLGTGTATVTLSASGQTSAQVPLTGTATVTLPATGTLTGAPAVPLGTGTATVTLSASGQTSAQVPLTGAASVALSVSAALTVTPPVPLTGTATVTLSASAPITHHVQAWTLCVWTPESNGGGRPFKHGKRRQGVTVLINGGTVSLTQFPSAAEVEAADSVFRGGYDTPISDADRALVEAAGLGEFLSYRMVLADG